MSYVRGLRPAAPGSLGGFLDTELLKIQRATKTGTTNAADILTLADGDGRYLRYIPGDGVVWTSTYWTVPIADGLVFTATSGSFLEFESSGANPRAMWSAADPSFTTYWGFGAAKPSGRYTIEGDQAFEFQDTPYVATNKVLTEATGIVKNTQPAIPNDTSGAANQATVNAILAALRAHNII